MKDNFDVHKWNLNRYKETINEIDIDDYTDKNVNSDEENSSFNITRGGDDPKIGAELESDSNVVGETEEKEYEVEYWKYTEDGYDNEYITVRAKSEKEALSKAKDNTRLSKNFKIYKG
tara:strand:+ start:625 stop:978 length:354 start_codon:yes stop_codon:yes gene_type:complete